MYLFLVKSLEIRFQLNAHVATCDSVLTFEMTCDLRCKPALIEPSSLDLYLCEARFNKTTTLEMIKASPQ